MNEKGIRRPANDDPAWLRKFKRTTVAAVAVLVGVVLATTFDLAEKMFHITDRFGLTTSETTTLARETMTLARESEKSRFSDALIRAAHKRLMLAEVYARRVQDDANGAQVDEAFKFYVAAVIDWNADVLTYIVGLEAYYTADKSREFERIIQPAFAELDSAVRSLYLRRLGKRPETEPDPGPFVFEKSNRLRDLLYVFVRCFKRDEAWSKTGGCDLGRYAKVLDELEEAIKTHQMPE